MQFSKLLAIFQLECLEYVNAVWRFGLLKDCKSCGAGAGSSGGLFHFNLDGKSGSNILTNPYYGGLTTINGFVLGPVLSPVVGPFWESIGTGTYQIFLEETLNEKQNE